MKNDVLFGMIVGCMVGATLVTFCKPTQNIIKKGAKMIKDEAENVFNKNKDDEEE